MVERQVEQQVGQQVAMGGTETAEVDEQPAIYVGDPHRTRKQKENQRKKESCRRRKKKTALGASQADSEEVVNGTNDGIRQH